MQKQRSLPLLLIPFLSIAVVCKAQHTDTKTNSDSLLPACILQMKEKDSLVTSTEYNYKGQRWFAIGKRHVGPPLNYSDQQTITKFYNDSCKLVCTWTKGGIAALNRVKPDTVEKEKILTLPINTSPKNPATTNTLPDSIAKIALKKNCYWIEETVYDGKLVYRFQNPLDKPSTSKITFVTPYFDENGNIISPIKFMRRAFWWHNVNGNFSKTQFRPGYR